MILVTGISGNTGTSVLKTLCGLVPRKEIVGIVRSQQYQNQFDIQIEYGDLSDLNFLETVYQKYSITEIIHVANIRLSQNIMQLSEKYKVKRNILVHTTGVYSKYQEYNSLYNQIEKDVMKNTYEHTSFVIVRPSMIYGNERDYNMHKLVKFLSWFPLFPIFGDGKSLMQPIHVEDLAKAIVQVFERKDIINEGFNITGKSVLEYQQIVEMIATYLNKSVYLIKIPIPLAIFLAKCAKIILRKSIITIEQIERLQEDKAYSHEKAVEVFGFSPRTFEQGIKEEIELLKSKGLIK